MNSASSGNSSSNGNGNGAARPKLKSDHSHPAPDDADGGPGKKRKLSTGRTSQACTRCRSLKMKCIGATDPPCRRCRRTGATCDFVPRANAARPWSPGPYPAHTCTELWRSDVMSRIKALEAVQARFESLVTQLRGRGLTTVDENLGAPSEMPRPHRGSVDTLELDFGVEEGEDDDEGHEHHDDIPPEYTGVLDAVYRLKNELPARLANSEAWAPTTVGRLWESFRANMPGLHFFSGQVSFLHPTPLLAVAILYVATQHSQSAELARHGSVYFQAFTRSIGALSLPDCPIRGKTADDGSPSGSTSGNMDDVLGIILVGLLAVGWVDTVGMWVNTAYRLLLDGMAEERGKLQAEWRGIWEGLRTIELEHSSLHLICPALPSSPPNPPFSPLIPQPDKDAGGSIGELLQIMQRCMPRFVGRGLPTVWETVCEPNTMPRNPINTGPDDMTAIRAWAEEIDAWYSRVAADTTEASLYIRAIILLNYHLHKLFVLSIFFPLRGVAATSISEREELLASSRLVLRIEASGFEVWSSWDLVMITNASLVLLQAWAAGAAGQEDLNLINSHLNSLTCTQQAPPSLRHTLATRLETALQQVRTPVRASARLPHSPTQSTVELVNRYSNQVLLGPMSAGSSASGPSPSGPGPQNGMKGDDSGYLFMNMTEPTNLLPELPTFDIPADPSIGDWPPFLLNLFGEDPNMAGMNNPNMSHNPPNPGMNMEPPMNPSISPTMPMQPPMHAHGVPVHSVHGVHGVHSQVHGPIH